MKRTADLPHHPPPVVGFADCYTGGFVDAFHVHDRAQLSLFLAGSVTINTQDESFVLGPGQGMWLPANTLHQATCRTDLAFQVVYVDSSLIGPDLLPSKMFEASSLIRGLVDEIIAMTFQFTMDERMSAIARLLVDEVRRGRRIAERLLFPSDHGCGGFAKQLLRNREMGTILIIGPARLAWHAALLPAFSSRKWAWVLRHGVVGCGWLRLPHGLRPGNQLPKWRLTSGMTTQAVLAQCSIAHSAWPPVHSASVQYRHHFRNWAWCRR